MTSKWQWLKNEINSTMAYVLDGTHTDAVEIAESLIQRFWSLDEDDMPQAVWLWSVMRITQLERYVRGERS